MFPLESRKRKVENSDSDGDDEFYDRTGAVERKRTEKSASQQNNALSYAELVRKQIFQYIFDAIIILFEFS